MSRYLFLLQLLAAATAFLTPIQQTRRANLLFAKKKSTTGQGFGKAPEKSSTRSSAPPAIGDSAPLQSIETDASGAIPTITAQPKKIETDSSLSAEERAKQVLREQYGLKTLEEQQMDQKKRERTEESRRKREEWKQMAEQEDFDILAIIPAPLLVALDRFLKIGLGICTVLFVSAGLGITAEAWSKASGNPLPDDVDAFIVNVIEPNFTPGLLVLLGFSISLGVLSALQLGSAGATYKEDK